MKNSFKKQDQIKILYTEYKYNLNTIEMNFVCCNINKNLTFKVPLCHFVKTNKLASNFIKADFE